MKKIEPSCQYAEHLKTRTRSHSIDKARRKKMKKTSETILQLIDRELDYGSPQPYYFSLLLVSAFAF